MAHHRNRKLTVGDDQFLWYVGHRGLNLNEPGVALAEAVSRGWDANSNAHVEMNGWELFDGVASRRAGRV